MSHHARYIKILKETKVEEIAPTIENLVALDRNVTVPEALQQLIEVGVVSAPVMDTQNMTYIGLVDTLDILAYVVGIFEDVEHKGATIFSRLSTGEKFNNQP